MYYLTHIHSSNSALPQKLSYDMLIITKHAISIKFGTVGKINIIEYSFQL